METVRLAGTVDMLLMGIFIQKKKDLPLVLLILSSTKSQALAETWTYHNEQDMVETLKKSTMSWRYWEHLINVQDGQNRKLTMRHSAKVDPKRMTYTPHSVESES